MKDSKTYTKYFIEVFSEEHMLFAKEIASLYDIMDSKGNPNYSLVGKAINEYIKENNIEYNQLFYNTKNGLRKVFPKHIYIPALKYYKDKYGYF